MVQSVKITKFCAILLALLCALSASACSPGDGAEDVSAEGSDAAGPGPVAESEATVGLADENVDDTPAASPGMEQTGQSPPPSADTTVTLIGDSVVLGGVDAVKEAVPGIDIRARNDRQLAGPGLDTLRQEEADGELGQIVVLALGTNFVTRGDIDEAMQVIGPERQVVFVNAYRGRADYIEEVNEAISEAAADNASNFTIADWYGYVSSHPDTKLASDDCHLTKSSAADYAKVIRAGVDSAAAKLREA
jgi:hypothetical protein